MRLCRLYRRADAVGSLTDVYCISELLNDDTISCIDSVSLYCHETISVVVVDVNGDNSSLTTCKSKEEGEDGD